MKFVIFLTVICLISNALGASFHIKRAQSRKTNVQQCRIDSKISNDDFYRLMDGKFDNPSKEMKDLVKCTYDNNNAIVNGVMQKDAIRGMFSPGNHQKEFEEVLEKCIKPVGECDSADPADIAYNFLVCFRTA